MAQAKNFAGANVATAGDDSLDGGPGDFDLLTGGPGNDKIGGSGADTLIGDPGSANRLDGGPGDEAFGGPGSDECDGGFSAEISCGPSQGMSGTAVELYESIDGATSLIITGGEGDDNATVSFDAGTYTVSGGPGSAEVLPGNPTSTACSRDELANSVSCRGHVSSILVSLGGGNDTFAVAASVPAPVSSIIDGGKGSDDLRGGPGNDLLIGGQPCDGDLFDGGARLQRQRLFCSRAQQRDLRQGVDRRRCPRSRCGSVRRRPYRQPHREDRGFSGARHPGG